MFTDKPGSRIEAVIELAMPIVVTVIPRTPVKN